MQFAILDRTPVSPATSLLPLVFVITVTAIKQVIVILDVYLISFFASCSVRVAANCRTCSGNSIHLVLICASLTEYLVKYFFCFKDGTIDILSNEKTIPSNLIKVHTVREN